MFMMAISVAVATAPLAPSEKWVVNYAPEMCTLSRAYGGADGPVLAFRAWPLSTALDVMVIFPLKGLVGEPQTGDAKLQFSTDPQPRKLIYARYDVAKARHRLFELHIGTGKVPDISQAASVDTTLPGHRTAFQLPKFAAALAALKTCNDELVKSWGIDPDEEAHVATPAELTKDLRNSIGPQDYPARALSMSHYGTTNMLLTIDTAGRVSDCRVTGRSGSPELDTAACNAFKANVRFHPAIGHDGKPMVTHYTQRLRWGLNDAIAP